MYKRLKRLKDVDNLKIFNSQYHNWSNFQIGSKLNAVFINRTRFLRNKKKSYPIPTSLSLFNFIEKAIRITNRITLFQGNQRKSKEKKTRFIAVELLDLVLKCINFF